MKNINLKKETRKVDVIYIRVSSKEQVLGFSLDSQEKICREFSAKSGHIVLQVFREEGESAKTTNRTQLQEMVRFCEKNKKLIGRIVFYSVSRMSRDVADYQILRKLFEKYGISIVSATESFDNSPSGKLHENILSAFAQFDNDARSVKTIEGMKARLLRGLWSTIAPWGYRNTRDELDKKIIVPHIEKLPVVKMLFEKYATGKYTFKELASMANKLGQKSRHGMKISKQLVSKIIANPVYCGMIVFPKFEISLMGSHKPIISDKLFKQAQDVRNGVAGRKMPRNKDNKDFPLRGIKCDGCGKNISGGQSKGKTKYYKYYSCINQDCLKRKSIKKEDLENDFTNFLIKLTPNDFFFDCLKEAIKLAHKAELNSVASSETKIKTKITELKNKKENLLNLRLEGGMTTSEFSLNNEKFNSQIKDLENSLIALSPPELQVEKVIDSGIEFLKQFPENWKSLDVKDLRVLRPLLFPQNLIYAYPNIKTLKLSPIYNIKSEFSDEKNLQVTLRRIELRLTD